jgi:maltooligosyltrehalose trehalohydrolase
MPSPARPSHGPQAHDDGTTTFSLWAPEPDEVVLHVDGEEHATEALERGWRRATVPAGHEARYGFSLDGGDLRPDPASRWQPDGVHGLSAVVDPARLVPPVPEGWSAPSILDGAIYEVHIGTFTDEGTFDAAARRLGHLRDLGVTHVEIMPINAFNGDHGWGYDGVAWYAVHAPYGGPEGFARFVAACHEAGLGVLLDVVHNHLGPSGNYLPEFGPYLGGEGVWGAGLNLDGPGSDQVRDFIVGNALQWCRDYGVDGLRLDAVHALLDSSATHVLGALSDAVGAYSAESGRRVELIAESDRNDPATVMPTDEHGFGMDAQWADELHHAIHVAVTGEHEGYYVDVDPAGLPDVAAAYRRGFVHDGTRYSPFRERTPGAPLGDVDGRRLVGCVQNHDQVGNRAAGDRLLAITDPALVRVAALLLCAAPHTPMLFMGEEHGETNPFAYFTSHPEPELAEAVRKGRAEEFAGFSAFSGAEVPDPQAESTFTASRIDWAKADTESGRAWMALWTDLLRLRREQPSLSDGRRDLVTVHHLADRLLSLGRGDGAGSVVVAVNLGDDATAVPAPGASEVLLATSDERYGGDGAAIDLTDDAVHLPPRTAVLLRAPAS